MLVASWEVRTGKICDRGLENTARGRRPRTAFQARGHSFSLRSGVLFERIEEGKRESEKNSEYREEGRDRRLFFPIRTDPKPANNILIFLFFLL